MPSFFISKFCTAASTGTRLRAFLASQELQRGAETGGALLAHQHRGVPERSVGCRGLVKAWMNAVGLVGMTPSCILPGEDPRADETKLVA